MNRDNQLRGDRVDHSALRLDRCGPPPCLWPSQIAAALLPAGGLPPWLRLNAPALDLLRMIVRVLLLARVYRADEALNLRCCNSPQPDPLG